MWTADTAHDRDIAGWRTSLCDAGEGPPVLLVHGASVAADARLTWFRTVPALARAHRVVAYDQPGFGASAVPPPGGYLDREARACHAAALIDALGLEDLAVIGHSEGGYIAARLALLRPERIARIVIVASGGAAPRLGKRRDLAWMAAATRAYDYVARSVDEDTFVRSEGRLAQRPDPPFEQILRANFRRARDTGNLDMFLALQRTRTGYEDYTALQERNLLAHAALLRAPALLVWGGRDETVPVARGAALAERLPDAELHVLRDAGHWVMHEAAAAFNGLVAGWLSRS